MSDGTAHLLKPGAVERSRIASQYREQYHNRLKAKYDAAQTTPENEIHWAYTDSLSADAAASPGVRKKIRDRSRYEAENNSYYAGALNADADAAIGPGPNLRFFFGLDEVDSQARYLFQQYARRIRLAYKLRQLRIARNRDGEGLAVRFNNLRLPDDTPQTDIRLIDCDRLEAPYEAWTDPKNIDGVLLDDNFEPRAYQILEHHPGDTNRFGRGGIDEVRTYDAADVIHYYNATRPEQHRGLPVVTSCLGLFAQFRRVTLAVQTAFETAANVAAMLKLDATIVADAISGDQNSSGLILSDDELFEIVRGSIPALPPGYSLEQLKAEQPTSTLEMFERVVLRQVARAFGMPRIVLAGDTGEATQSAGNIDYRFWWQHLESDRSDIDVEVVDRVADWWWEDQRRIPSDRGQTSLPIVYRDIDRPRRRTTWSTRFEHNDPQKNAEAIKTLHELGLLTDDRYWEMSNLDPTESAAELTRQVERRTAQGINPVGGGPLVSQTNDGQSQDDRDSGAGDG